MVNKTLDFALKKLAKRAYSVNELKKAMLSAGFDTSETDMVIDKLLCKGYLNDMLLAQELYDYYTQQKPCGPILLAQIFKNKGLRDDLFEKLIEDYDSEKEMEIIHRLLAKLMRREKNKNEEYLSRHLQRKGFSSDSIQKALNSYWRDKKFSSIYPD